MKMQWLSRIEFSHFQNLLFEHHQYTSDHPYLGAFSFYTDYS
jgi:hypothetical protein